MEKSCEKYDIYEDRWEELPALNTPRQNCSLAIHNQKNLYAFSGYDGKINIDSYEVLNLTNESEGKFIIL